MVILSKGDWVWFRKGDGGEFDVPIGARVTLSDTGQIKLIDDEKEVRLSLYPPSIRRIIEL
jgi:hypothetical protein